MTFVQCISLRRAIPYLLAIGMLFCECSSSFAATVRGRISRGNYPAPYITVTLYSQQYGWSSPALTGFDGMYYLYNVPPGQYMLHLWFGGPQPLVYTITVQDPLTDLLPLSVP